MLFTPLPSLSAFAMQKFPFSFTDSVLNFVTFPALFVSFPFRSVLCFTGTNNRRHLIFWKYNSSGCLTTLKNRCAMESLTYSKYSKDIRVFCPNRPFPSSLQSLFRSESKCEIFIMVISSNFNRNENRFRTLPGGGGELGNGLLTHFFSV